MSTINACNPTFRSALRLIGWCRRGRRYRTGRNIALLLNIAVHDAIIGGTVILRALVLLLVEFFVGRAALRERRT